MPPITRVDILYFDGCPNVTPTVDRVRAVATRLGVRIDVHFVRVMSDADAERECFIGSPSVRVNGIDIDPSASGRFELGVSCRTYGGARIPPEPMIAAALQGVARVPTSGRVSLAAVGSVIAAAVSSACCWLPLVLVAAGVSAGGVAIAFAPYRPWFVALAVAALAFGVWTNERRSGPEQTCECSPVSSRRRAWNRFMLAISAVGLVAFALFPRYVEAVFGQRPPVQTRDARPDLTLRVEGMTCTGCETGIEAALRRVPGVALADASYGDGTVVVGLIPDATVDADALVEAVAQAGYSAVSDQTTSSPQQADIPSASVTVLSDDIKSLAKSFNDAASRHRFLAILSPT